LSSSKRGKLLDKDEDEGTEGNLIREVLMHSKTSRLAKNGVT
jgi:hypothetical protein